MRCNTLIILVRLIKCISIMGEEVQILGGGGGWIPRITSEILHQVTEVRRMARVTEGEMAGCSPGQRQSQARLEQLRPPDKSP